MSMLSTNNSDAFLQNLAHIDKRDHHRHDQETARPDDMVLLEKQGRCSQKLRNNTVGNLAQISIAIGQNMTDISNIGNSSPTSKVPKIVSNLSSITQSALLPPRKDRGASLPPSALPRPPRSLKPPRKIEYGRLSDSDTKKCSQTPPKSSNSTSTIAPSQSNLDQEKEYELKTSSLKRNVCSNVKREFSPCKNYMESMQFAKANDNSGLKAKNYGSINKIESKFGFKPTMNDFCKPEYTSTKNYQRLDEAPLHFAQSRKNSQDSSSMKRSLLPGARKLGSVLAQSTTATPLSASKNNTNKGSRDSLNSVSSGSNSNNRSSPVHSKTDSSLSTTTFSQHQFSRMTPPMDAKKFLQKTKLQAPMLMKQIKTSSLPSSSILHAAAVAASSSLPPKPIDAKAQRRGASLTRGENKYRIQF